MDIEEEVRAMRLEITRLLDRVDRPLPLVLTKKRAAKELSIGITKLKGLISAGLITTIMMDRVSMISTREVRRVATDGTHPAKAPRGKAPPRPRKASKTSTAAEEVERARELLAARRKQRR